MPRSLYIYPIVILILLTQEKGISQNCYRVVSYNTENLFDTSPSKLHNDQIFTPNGEKFWSNRRYQKKLLLLASSITELIKRDSFTLAIALQEIENRDILIDLTQKTQLAHHPLGIIHRDGPDERGIDIALLFNKKHFFPIYTRFISFEEKGINTRELIHTVGVTNKHDTIAFIACHLPSRLSGKEQSEKEQSIVLKSIDLIIRESKYTTFILGDFNADHPTIERLIRWSLTPNCSSPYNASLTTSIGQLGTYKFKGKWEFIDHIYIYHPTLSINEIKIISQQMSFNQLLTADKRYGGMQPHPTYRGRYYMGGTSDHLPISILVRIETINNHKSK